MSTKLVTPIQAIALASLSRKVNGDKAFTDIQGEPCGPRALIEPGEYHGRFVPGIGFGIVIGEPKPKAATVPWSKIAALLANRVNTETMAKVVELALQGRFETMDTAKNALVKPLKAPQLANGKLTTKYLDVFAVKVSVDIDKQG
jgi:hypothetical protein